MTALHTYYWMILSRVHPAIVGVGGQTKGKSSGGFRNISSSTVARGLLRPMRLPTLTSASDKRDKRHGFTVYPNIEICCSAKAVQVVCCMILI